MSKSNLHETAILKLVFQNIAHANIGDASGLQPSASAGSLYIALYTTNPGETDTGTEATYTSYSRVSAARSVVGFTVSGDSVINAALLTYPTSTGGSNLITHFAIRTASSGGDMLRYGALTSSLTINSGDTPKFNAGDLESTED